MTCAEAWIPECGLSLRSTPFRDDEGGGGDRKGAGRCDDGDGGGSGRRPPVARLVVHRIAGTDGEAWIPDTSSFAALGRRSGMTKVEGAALFSPSSSRAKPERSGGADPGSMPRPISGGWTVRTTHRAFSIVPLDDLRRGMDPGYVVLRCARTSFRDDEGGGAQAPSPSSLSSVPMRPARVARHSGAAQRNPESRAPAPGAGAGAPRISATVTTLDSGFRCAAPE